MILRDYQQDAVGSIYRYLRSSDGNPCAVIPTGGGKTLVLAQVCRDAVEQWDGRVIVLAHVKELLEQNADKIRRLAPSIGVGVYSAGLRSRDTAEPVIVAGIQSVYKRACELGAFNLAIVDEAHLIPPSGEGMYRQFLAEAAIVNPRLRVIGLTATPYRTSTGELCGPNEILTEVCHETEVAELIDRGFLCPLVSKKSQKHVDASGVHVRGGEFVASEVEAVMNADSIVKAAVAEIVEKTADRKSVLVFAAGVDHGENVERLLRDHGCDAASIFGHTDRLDRAELIEDFRNGQLKYLVNCQVLTTGFDAPGIDCICILRMTLSPGLYYQMAGRGLRIAEGKTDCLILDFGGNVLRHGPIGRISTPRSRDGSGVMEDDGTDVDEAFEACPECQSVIEQRERVCPDCGCEKPVQERAPNNNPKHAATASDEVPVSGRVAYEIHDVKAIRYSVHRKKGAGDDHPKTLRVQYETGFFRFANEWICVEHGGWARSKALEWWSRRCRLPCPTSAAEAVEIASSDMFAETKAVKVKIEAGEKYPEIVGYQIGDVPEIEPGMDLSEPVLVGDGFGVAEVPF